jgi:hypothetical protein
MLCAMAAVALAAGGCGDDDDDTDAGADSGGDTDTDTDTDADTDPGPDIVTATITVPSDFEATPEQLVAYFHQWYPPAGDAAATAGSYMSPEIGPDTPFELETDHAGLDGAYYLWVVLFVEGGGEGASPVQGVDWVGGSPVPLSLGTGAGTNDVGTIQLQLYF